MDLPVKEPKLKSEHLDYLKITLNIRDGKAEAYLLSRMGYSSSGIANRIGSTKGTVEKYLDELEDEYGREAVYVCSGENEGILSPLPGVDKVNKNQDEL